MLNGQQMAIIRRKESEKEALYREPDLGKLFREAREYGRVSVSTMDSGLYHCCITFNSIDHTKLEARSRFDHNSPEQAVMAALDKAKEVQSHFKAS